MVPNILDQLPQPGNQLSSWPWRPDATLPVYDSGLQWPKISIVTPSFNQGKFIEESIRSVLLQNYPNLEYIIIDGGSKDETISIIRKYEPWISYWVSEGDGGQSHAINKGMERCTGDIFNWLNSDDYYFSNTLFEVAKHFLDNPDATTVSGKEEHLKLDGSRVIENGTFIRGSLLQTLEFVEMAQPSTFFRFACLKKIGRVAEDLHYIMDGELWIRYLLLYGQGSFLKIDAPLVHFRMHRNSKTVQSSVIHHFLFERSSIIVDLLKFSGVPNRILNYWANDVYKTSTLYNLNRDWKMDRKYISKRSIRLYFIKKYILLQFLRKNKSAACWGAKQLLKNYCFDAFTLKSFLKLIF